LFLTLFIAGTVDAATDIYVISTYYGSDDLIPQANAFVAMLSTNLGIQLLCVFSICKNKSWGFKLKEALITLLFLRPAVDAYRVTSNHQDDEIIMDSLGEMVVNKVSERAAQI